jgi:hypothetical protein
MRKDHRTALFLTAALVTFATLASSGMTSLGTTPAYAQGSTDKAQPPLPAWVDADGKVNLDKAPREVPIAGPDGKHQKDEKGYDKMVPSHMNATPPPPLR